MHTHTQRDRQIQRERCIWFLWRLGKPIRPRQDSKEPLDLALRWEPMLDPLGGRSDVM